MATHTHRRIPAAPDHRRLESLQGVVAMNAYRLLLVALMLMAMVGVGSAYNTSTIVSYPNIGGYDAYFEKLNAANDTFIELLNEPTAGTVWSTLSSITVGVSSNSTSGIYRNIQRSQFIFSNSSTPANVNVTSGTLSVNNTAVTAFLGSAQYTITACYPTSTTPQVGDLNTIYYSDTPLSDYVTFTAGQRKNFTFNTAGLQYLNAVIQSGGKINVSIRSKWDVEKSSPTWAASTNSRVDLVSNESTAIISRPFFKYTYTDQYVPPMRTLNRNATPMHIDTDDGGDQIVHPYAVYVPEGWNGYHYIMAFEPYAFGNTSLENPTIRVSNNFLDWVKLPGQGTDPIFPSSGTTFKPDACIVVKDGTLYMMYSNATAGDPLNFYNWISSTTDGITWTAPVITNTTNGGPNLVWNGTAWNLYRVTGAYDVHRSTSPDLITWTYPGDLFYPQPGTIPWAHSEFKMYDSQVQSLIATRDFAGLYFFNSSNELTTAPSPNNPVLVNSTNPLDWDYQLYKSTFIEISGNYYVIYGAFNGTYPTIHWNVGYTSYPAGLFPPTYPDPTYPPTASFTTNVTSGVAPLVVQFTDTSINTPTSWGWFFANATGNNTIIQFSTSQNPIQIFGIGNYTIHLNATNSYGSNVTPNDYWINVSSGTPPVTPLPVVDFSANNLSFCLHNSTQFTDVSVTSITNWAWTFGDGNTSALTNPNHTYDFAGTFDVSLQVTNASGINATTKTGYITVNSCAPPSPPANNTAGYTNGAPNAVPLAIVIFIAIVGGLCLAIAVFVRPESGGDVFAVIAPFPLLISAWQFLFVDIISDGPPVSHTIYAMYPEAAIMLVVFGISILNAYRVIMLTRNNSSNEDNE